MPKRESYYQPDLIDCQSQCHAIGEDFGCICELSVTFTADYVVVIARCRKINEDVENPPLVQALVRKPLKASNSLAVMIFSALQDCWHQLDRGTLGATTPAISHLWNGRPEIARRRQR